MFTHVQSVAIKQLVCGKCQRETIGFEGGIDDMSVNRNLETISSMVADPMIAIVSRFSCDVGIAQEWESLSTQ